MGEGTHIGLVVGIDDYPGDELESAVADANAIADLLERDGDGATPAQGTPRWDCTRIVGPGEGTEDRVENAIRRMVDPLVCKDKHLLFWFSGHARAPEGRLRLETIDHYVASSLVVDMFNSCPAASVTIILDCCFSGSVGDQPVVYSTGSVHTGHTSAILRENLAVLTASRGREKAIDGDEHSPFTTLLLAGLDGGAADHQGAVSIVDLFGYVSGYFLPGEQRPQLKINMTDEPFVLRRVTPRVPEAVLEKLAVWFPEVTSEKQLTPDHEGDRPDWPPTTPLTDLQVEFDEIGRVRNLGMIDSVVEGEPHYWAALHGHVIRLSPLGQWYWRKLDKRRRGPEA